MRTVQDPQTQQSPTRRRTFEPPEDDELLRRLGPLMWEAYVAFITGSTYFTEMVETANSLDRRRVATETSLRRRRAQAAAKDDA